MIEGDEFGQVVKLNVNATEVCNGVDDDCDGLVDESYSLIVSNNADNGVNTLRAILNCAQDGETITFAAAIDTITLLSPIVINKNINLLDANGSKVVIRGNLNAPGFTNANAMVSLLPGKLISCENLRFLQSNNTVQKPIIHNQASLTLIHCEISGDPASVVKNEIDATFHTVGIVKVN